MFKYLFNPYKRAVDAIDRSRAGTREFALRKGIIAEDDDLFKELPPSEPVRLDAETRREIVAAIDKSRAEMREFALRRWIITENEDMFAALTPRAKKTRAKEPTKGRDESQKGNGKKGWLAYL